MKIIMKDIRIYAYHGVMPQEKIVGDWYTINLQLTLCNEKACESDNLEETVNYAEVYELVKKDMSIPSKLIEHACGRICKDILSQFNLISEVTITMFKQNPPMGADCSGCGVELTMSK